MSESSAVSSNLSDRNCNLCDADVEIIGITDITYIYIYVYLRSKTIICFAVELNRMRPFRVFMSLCRSFVSD